MLVIGIAGGSGSGKTTVVRKIVERLGDKVTVIPEDSYYKDLSHLTEYEKRIHNFDHPDSIEFDLLTEHLRQLKEGKTIEQPIYSYLTCTRSKTETVTVLPTEVVIVEGILAFCNASLRDQLDIKIYVYADDDDRLMRIISRDCLERGKTVDWVMERYTNTVKPMHREFIDPSKRYADIIVLEGGYNKVAIDMIIATIEKELNAS